MNNKKKFILIIVFIILIVFLLIGFVVIRGKIQENTLKNEINSLKELDITKDRYNKPIKTKGNYAVLEEAIKDYLDDYAVNLQSVLSILKDDEFTNLLLADNYLEDIEFKEQFLFIEKTRKSFNTKINKLIENCDKDSIKDYIKTKMKSKYYIALYEELMLDNNVSSEIIESKELLSKTKDRVNLMLDTSEEIFSFLKKHKDEWVVENGEVKFRSQVLLNEYNTYLAKVRQDKRMRNYAFFMLLLICKEKKVVI